MKSQSEVRETEIKVFLYSMKRVVKNQKGGRIFPKSLFSGVGCSAYYALAIPGPQALADSDKEHIIKGQEAP